VFITAGPFTGSTKNKRKKCVKKQVIWATMHGAPHWEAVAPAAKRQCASTIAARDQKQRFLACGAAVLVLGCLIHVIGHGDRVVALSAGSIVVNGESVLEGAGLSLSGAASRAGSITRFPIDKLHYIGDTPLLDKSPQASHLAGDLFRGSQKYPGVMPPHAEEVGPSGSQQGEQPGHWGGVGSENYGTPLWDNTGWNAHYHPRDGASMDSESMEPWYWRKGPRVNDEYTVRCPEADADMSKWNL
jgi:hypothetical protein